MKKGIILIPLLAVALCFCFPATALAAEMVGGAALDLTCEDGKVVGYTNSGAAYSECAGDDTNCTTGEKLYSFKVDAIDGDTRVVNSVSFTKTSQDTYTHIDYEGVLLTARERAGAGSGGTDGTTTECLEAAAGTGLRVSKVASFDSASTSTTQPSLDYTVVVSDAEGQVEFAAAAQHTVAQNGEIVATEILREDWTGTGSDVDLVAVVSIEGQAEVSTEGEQVSTEGEQVSTEGEAQVSIEGEAEVSTEGEAEVSTEGEQVSIEGEAQVSTEGEQVSTEGQ